MTLAPIKYNLDTKNAYGWVQTVITILVVWYTKSRLTPNIMKTDDNFKLV